MSLRALGGADLVGDSLARFIYLDEAGISSAKQEPWLVVGGLLVHGDHQLDSLYSALESVARKHLTESLQDTLVLHASDIYGGNGKVFDKKLNPEWTPARRMALMADLAMIPRATNILISAAWVQRSQFPKSAELLAVKDTADMTLHAHAAAYMACLMEADIWIRKNAKRENCMVIVEDNQRARAAIRQVHRYHQDKQMPLTEDLKPYFPLQRVREDPAFQEKRPSHPLVLADFVAFVVKRRLMNDPWISPYFEPLRPLIAKLSLAGLV